MAALAAAASTPLLHPAVTMDIHVYFHQWLLFLSFLLMVHQCQDVAGAMHHACPQGQIAHRDQRLGWDYVSCCYPTRCGVGFEVVACRTSGSNDTCEACGPSTNQSRRTSSFTMEKRCIPWPLNKKCQTVGTGRREPEDPITQRCLCDVEKGYMFQTPEVFSQGTPMEAFCQSSRNRCNPGYEPTINGNCRPCDENHFKATRSYHLCEPKTDCEQLGLQFTSKSDATADNNCSEPEVLTTPKPEVTTRTTPPKPVTKKEDIVKTPPVVQTTTQREDPPETGSSQSSTEDSSDDAGIPIWPIIIGVILVIVVVVFIIFLIRRRRIPFRNCLGLKVNDLEKYSSSQCPASLPAGDYHHHHHLKNGPTGGHFILGPGEKVMNNNINGGLVHGSVESPHIPSLQRQPHLQHNGGTFVQFSGTDSSDSETVMHFQNQQNSFQASVVPPTARPGILRNGNKPHQGQVAYAQACAPRPPDASMDSIGREKLHVNIDRYQANQELGENDPLLITEDLAGGGGGTLPGQGVVFQNRGGGVVTKHSPPVQQAASGQVVYLPHNANFNPHCQNVAGYVNPISNINPNISGSISSGNSSPAVPSGGQQQTHQVTFAPTLDTVTYKRSLSVIANPEGEAEEELEANVPRFSQLLPNSEDPSMTPSNPILRMAQEREALAIDSPQRDVTHQTRMPTERLQTRLPTERLQTRLPQPNPLAPTFVSPAPPAEPVARRPLLNCRPPFFTGPPSSSMDNVPDHCIMDLKEHQLANSLSLSSANMSGETMLKHAADTNFNLEDFTASSPDQTDMKTPGGTIKEEDRHSAGAWANSKVRPDDRIRKQSGGGGVTAQNVNTTEANPSAVDNRRLPQGSNSVDRRRTPSGGSGGGSGGGVPNATDRKRVPSGDKQKSCLKNSGQEDVEVGVNKRPQRLGRGVSFEEDEVKRDNNSLCHDTEPKQIRDSTHSSEDQNSECHSDLEDSSDKMRRTSSNGGDTDLSSSESTQSSPSRTNMYRRSQSESTTGSTDSGHKPPPRSMSEEKSQKADRPIAKVKPMPASDSSVNQVPAGSGAAEEMAATTMSSTATEESEVEDESSLASSSAPDLHSSNAGDEADEEAEQGEEQEAERR